MSNYTVAVEDSKAKEIRERLTLEKLKTGKSIREIVTDILMNDKNFIYLQNSENSEKRNHAS